MVAVVVSAPTVEGTLVAPAVIQDLKLARKWLWWHQPSSLLPNAVMGGARVEVEELESAVGRSWKRRSEGDGLTGLPDGSRSGEPHELLLGVKGSTSVPTGCTRAFALFKLVKQMILQRH